jgi:hypothetical protein
MQEAHLAEHQQGGKSNGQAKAPDEEHDNLITSLTQLTLGKSAMHLSLTQALIYAASAHLFLHE